jgi:hypothetical protein
MLPAVRRQLAEYSIRTLYSILRARIFDDDRLNEVLWYVYEEAGLVDYLDLDDDELTGATRQM